MKAFLSEEGSDRVLELLAAEGSATTSRIAFVELHSAFARGRADGRLTSGQVAAASKEVDDRWTDLLVVELDDALSRSAARLAHEHRLRAADAIHLASASLVTEGAVRETIFACWDARLSDAASRLGFDVVPQALAE
ncbi:MAG: type II toxin-antitoxin system VapC family toxin [Actinomycetota bacterium]|nr:type II toxin-antitoxin system VapC family toxin [Actinomycetota bacterium]